MAAATFAELLAACSRRAVHLEMRDGYMLDAPGFIAWQGGRRLDPEDRASWWRPFLDTIVEATARRVAMDAS